MTRTPAQDAYDRLIDQLVTQWHILATANPARALLITGDRRADSCWENVRIAPEDDPGQAIYPQPLSNNRNREQTERQIRQWLAREPLAVIADA